MTAVFSDLSFRGACSWESALFKGPDNFNGCGYFHVSLLLFALRHICHWFEEDLGSEFVWHILGLRCSSPAAPTFSNEFGLAGTESSKDVKVDKACLRCSSHSPLALVPVFSLLK